MIGRVVDREAEPGGLTTCVESVAESTGVLMRSCSSRKEYDG